MWAHGALWFGVESIYRVYACRCVESQCQVEGLGFKVYLHRLEYLPITEYQASLGYPEKYCFVGLR